jgi:hypothetical protein
VRFKYRLIGQHSQWVDAGGERSAFFTDRRPGKYEFELMAANNDGLWSPSPARMRFYVAAAWFQKLWFKTLCVLAGVGLVAILYIQLRAVRARRSSGRVSDLWPALLHEHFLLAGWTSRRGADPRNRAARRYRYDGETPRSGCGELCSAPHRRTRAGLSGPWHHASEGSRHERDGTGCSSSGHG